MSFPAESHFFAVITLLDQLDPKAYNGKGLSMILRHQFHVPNLDFVPYMLGGDIDGKLNIEFTQIVSKFLMDRVRAGSLWVTPQMYVNLTTRVLEILHDE